MTMFDDGNNDYDYD